MYLKSLEIHGFKSFPDKITLEFGKGLTAVVGPNGSGKSNIGDSVRWVLGEQSTKTLRGNKMEDVIFSGTVTRKPMGFASVTLNIDNTDRVLADYGDEVSVTRKLYRSGESEYIVNGRAVRLKDINELFMDTGLGRDGYSIIGQGRIAEIVSAKSSERRDIFEEASGISKFRYKKSEAERKLSASEENLLRLSDIISELESRVEPLREQAEKAQKFTVLAERRKKLEISVWLNSLDELKAKSDEVKDRILVSRSEYENLENDIVNEEQKYQDGYRKMQECTVKSDSIRRKMLDEEKTASDMKSAIAVLKNDVKHCEEAVVSAKKGMEDCKSAEKSIECEEIRYKEKISELETDLESVATEISDTEKLLDDAEKASAEAGKCADKAVSEINSLKIEQNEYRFKSESALKTAEQEKKRLEELKTSTGSYGKSLDDYKSRISELSAKLDENTSKLEVLRNELEESERDVSVKKSEFERSKTELESTLYELRDRQQRNKILHDLENSLEGFSGSVKVILRASKQRKLSGVYGTVAQNTVTEQKYATAVETALGGAMQNIVVENESTAKECINYLKEQRGGRATFLPLTSVNGYELKEYGIENCRGFVSLASRIVKYDEKFRGIVNSLLGRTVIAENIDFAVEIAKKYGYKFRIVTLDGQVINSGGSFTGGSVQKTVGLITRRSETERLEREIQDLLLKCDRIKECTEKLRTDAEKSIHCTERIKLEMQECESENVKASAELASTKSLMEQVRIQSENSAVLISECERGIKSAERVLDDCEIQYKKVSECIGKYTEELEKYRKAREDSRILRAELSEKISLARIREKEISKDIEAKKEQSERNGERIAELQRKYISYSSEAERQKSLILSKNSEIECTEKKLGGLKDNTSLYLGQIKQFQEQYESYSKLVNELRKSIKQLNDAKEKYSADITRLEERSESLQRDTDTIVKQMFETYEVTRSEAVKIAEPSVDILKTQKELMEVKSQIRSLGSVNTGAVEEYREVSERYRFMSEQAEDARRSKAELESIISELTSEMCRIFSESFEKINNSFKKIFTELFGGGSAELVLTDPENVLESGIEINVAPPGKVIKSLISLSGGEQSFIAVAIYFAILELRPAPFCILDEIDAALDEANVSRYAQYLRKFTDTTQFVLVTHRRSAMEEADVLYGVTMQEDGISKLLKMEQTETV